jgi:deoxyhypusine monooxygenase
MQATSAIPSLVRVLTDATDDPVVRHESGEALGAIADPSTLPVLEECCKDARPEVSETCQIAARRVRWVMEHGQGAAPPGEEAGAAAGSAAAQPSPSPSAASPSDETLEENPYESVDPAPAKRKPLNTEVPAIQKQLIDQSLPLFERYKAMFSLRNNGSRGAVLALCTGLKDPSPLFRHEVAYVLGQLMNTASIDALKARVEDAAEHEMVRHEAAEALGAIGTSECVEFLQKFAGDETIMLRESCEIALDVVDYWSKTTTQDDTIGAGGEGKEVEGGK